MSLRFEKSKFFCNTMKQHTELKKALSENDVTN